MLVFDSLVVVLLVLMGFVVLCLDLQLVALSLLSELLLVLF